MSESKKNGVLSGMIWSFGERIMAQLVSTVVGIVLARLLLPEDYGIISIVMVFISLCNVFVTSGFGAAIVQKKEADAVDFDTAFFLSLFTSVALYLILFFCAPLIAEFYKNELLTSVIRVLGIRLILTSLNTMQQAYIRRQMKFKRFFVSTIFGTVFSCFVGILMAYQGYGVWALVGQYLSNTSISSVVLCFVCGWNPRFRFSREKAKTLFSASWKLLCAQLIATLSIDVRNLIVGKTIGTTELAYYEQGHKYPALFINNINSAINSVMLPAYSQRQDNISVVKSMLRKSVAIGVFLVAPLMVGMLVVADNFVVVVLTEKWLPIIPLLQIFCLSYLTRPIETTCHQAVIAIGRSDIALKIITAINVVSLSITIALSLITKNIVHVALVSLLGTLVSLVGFLVFAGKALNYKLGEQLKDLLPPITASAIMGVLVYLINLIPIHKPIILVIQVAVGVLTYVALSFLLKLEGCSYVVSILKKKAQKDS